MGVIRKYTRMYKPQQLSIPFDRAFLDMFLGKQNSNCVPGSKSDCAIWCKVQRCSYVPTISAIRCETAEKLAKNRVFGAIIEKIKECGAENKVTHFNCQMASKAYSVFRLWISHTTRADNGPGHELMFCTHHSTCRCEGGGVATCC